MLALDLTPKLEERLDALARKAGQSKSALAREAVIAYLEDLEGGYFAQERLDANEKRIPLETLLKEFERRRLIEFNLESGTGRFCPTRASKT